MGVPYELMFDYKQTLTQRLADATDLLIDFATLGEYGLEQPAGRTNRACEADRRPPARESQQSFSEVLFPNRDRGTERSECPSGEPSHGSRRNAARKRGVRDASLRFRASGAA
jgi:hypothetical protein